ncbi:MAG: ribulokinase [Ruminococcaceae bacterium]|nr:ribulokinase [Oscillospiraceae bacterium]
MAKYVIGIDYGTLSARAVLADTSDGRVLSSCEYIYPHGVMNEKDICGSEPSVRTALAHPDDYIEALTSTVKGVLSESGVLPEEVVGLSIDATSSSVLPILNDGTPLASLKEFSSDPHAYIKLWKHHGGEEQADRMTRVAMSRGEEWLNSYGGTVSAEWALPKMLETLERSPKVYNAAEKYSEIGDWLVSLLTGTERRSACQAGYKSMYQDGYPSEEYLNEVAPTFSSVLDKLKGEVVPPGTAIGYINENGEKLTGLKIGTAVSASAIDAHSALPAAKAVSDGDLTLIIGTSGCHILISKTDAPIKGICGKVMGGVVPDYRAYETGQSCVGDMFAWFINNCLPESYKKKAREEGIGDFDYLNLLAEKLDIDSIGLLVLDWWNGNRSPYVDYDLSGLMIGMTLMTKPEEIYHAMLSSIAYGTRRMVELYEEGGVKVERVFAVGGIPLKNPLLMQIMADVLGKSISVVDSKQAGAKGSAIYAAAAAEIYPDVEGAAEKMGDDCAAVYNPNPEAHAKFTRLYNMYVELSDGFAKSDVMKRLRNK